MKERIFKSKWMRKQEKVFQSNWIKERKNKYNKILYPESVEQELTELFEADRPKSME